MPANLRSLLLIALVIVAVVVTVAIKPGVQESPPLADEPTDASAAPAAEPLPRLLDLGSTTCIPCLMMKPVLDELRLEYSGSLQVDFIDVFRQRTQADAYQIRTIPTLIFFAADGEELHRHEGFLGKDDIVATWGRLGITLNGAGAPEETP